jgi:hypothetical protein
MKFKATVKRTVQQEAEFDVEAPDQLQAMSLLRETANDYNHPTFKTTGIYEWETNDFRVVSPKKKINIIIECPLPDVDFRRYTNATKEEEDDIVVETLRQFRKLHPDVDRYTVTVEDG